MHAGRLLEGAEVGRGRRRGRTRSMIRLTPPWRTASAVLHSRATSRSSAGWTRSSASPSDSPPRKRASSSVTRSAPTNERSSSSGGIASSRPPRHSESSGQRSTSWPGATISAVSAVRGRSLATTRSNSTPASASRAPSACVEAAFGQRHVLRARPAGRSRRRTTPRRAASDRAGASCDSERVLDLLHPLLHGPRHGLVAGSRAARGPGSAAPGTRPTLRPPSRASRPAPSRSRCRRGTTCSRPRCGRPARAGARRRFRTSAATSAASSRRSCRRRGIFARAGTLHPPAAAAVRAIFRWSANEPSRSLRFPKLPAELVRPERAQLLCQPLCQRGFPGRLGTDEDDPLDQDE